MSGPAVDPEPRGLKRLVVRDLDECRLRCELLLRFLQNGKGNVQETYYEIVDAIEQWEWEDCDCKFAQDAVAAARRESHAAAGSSTPSTEQRKLSNEQLDQIERNKQAALKRKREQEVAKIAENMQWLP